MVKDVTESNLPFTRIEIPDGVEITKFKKADDSVVVYKKHELHLLKCESIESAKKLRHEIIKSLELLDFYINQIEETGKIRYAR